MSFHCSTFCPVCFFFINNQFEIYLFSLFYSTVTWSFVESTAAPNASSKNVGGQVYLYMLLRADSSKEGENKYQLLVAALVPPHPAAGESDILAVDACNLIPLSTDVFIHAFIIIRIQNQLITFC